MNKSSYIKLTGVLALLGWTLGNSCLAEPLSYSPDRWPSRWSSIVQQGDVNRDRPGYGYGYDNRDNYRGRTVRQDNPWAHNSSVLFDVPSAQRPWGEPPRQRRREQRRDYYRDQARALPPAMNRYENPGYAYGNNYGYGAGLPSVNPAAGLAYQYTQPTSSLTWPYAVSPLLASPLVTSPLLGSPLLGYPYGGYPLGVTGMNWPFAAW